MDNLLYRSIAMWSMKYFRSNNPNTPIESFTYTCDKNGQILTEHHVSNLVSPPHDEKRTYTYNENGRLIRSESTLSGIVEYGFDKVGNRRVVTTNGNTEASYFTGLNQILRKINSAGISTNFVHCVNGNLIQEETRKANGTISNIRQFDYTVNNRLTEVRQGTAANSIRTVQTNVFRGDGQRITKREGAETINCTYRAGQVLYTTDEWGSRRAFNLYSPAGNIIAARQYCASSSFQDMYITYLSDIRGSIASIVDCGMSFIQGYRYTDYGITTRIGSGAFNEFAYTQGIWDETTGLYYLNARFYNPVDGRFLTQDPYRGSNDQPDTWHLHGYCAGDPVNWIDPSGHRREAISRGTASGSTRAAFRDTIRAYSINSPRVDRAFRFAGWAARSPLARIRMRAMSLAARNLPAGLGVRVEITGRRDHRDNIAMTLTARPVSGPVRVNGRTLIRYGGLQAHMRPQMLTRNGNWFSAGQTRTRTIPRHNRMTTSWTVRSNTRVDGAGVVFLLAGNRHSEYVTLRIRP